MSSDTDRTSSADTRSSIELHELKVLIDQPEPGNMEGDPSGQIRQKIGPIDELGLDDLSAPSTITDEMIKSKAGARTLTGKVESQAQLKKAICNLVQVRWMFEKSA
ncbi:Uu.00g056960.m01.CDS01 [Anthostomella pinea]|uniref:Uu.00g056960.m01.CDS01 n=1 Tax=Anthostomella pinea TaxID=933095 RepID=A0AAI8YJQ4_9PEZI|nr:Uu.00g056960.m01.CDS01 [Anthostomella pinea]